MVQKENMLELEIKSLSPKKAIPGGMVKKGEVHRAVVVRTKKRDQQERWKQDKI